MSLRGVPFLLPAPSVLRGVRRVEDPLQLLRYLLQRLEGPLWLFSGVSEALWFLTWAHLYRQLVWERCIIFSGRMKLSLLSSATRSPSPLGVLLFRENMPDIYPSFPPFMTSAFMQWNVTRKILPTLDACFFLSFLPSVIPLMFPLLTFILALMFPNQTFSDLAIRSITDWGSWSPPYISDSSPYNLKNKNTDKPTYRFVISYQILAIKT